MLPATPRLRVGCIFCPMLIFLTNLVDFAKARWEIRRTFRLPALRVVEKKQIASLEVRFDFRVCNR